MGLKLQILVPQYQETNAIVKPLLDSIALQQAIDFSEIGVIICNDGSDVFLSRDFLDQYPYDITYVKEPHCGVSATRNKLINMASSEYVMFCDADDMFGNVLGLWLIFREMAKGFDTLCSVFLEEIKDSDTSRIRYDIREHDGIFVHGKVHRRQYLIDRDIRFDENLSINEDSYFIALCQSLTNNLRYVDKPFYIWKWRDDSVSHCDPKYKFKAYYHMIVSNDALIKELICRDAVKQAELYAIQMVIDAYYILTNSEWFEEDNSEIYDAVYSRFSEWVHEHMDLWNNCNVDFKTVVLLELTGLSKKKAKNEVFEINKWLKDRN